MFVPLQVATAMAALVALTIWPPASGNMLLVPIAGTDTNGVARQALAGGAVLLGAGPFPGSMVVIGERFRIARQVRPWHILIMAAPPAGCGTGAGAGGSL